MPRNLLLRFASDEIDETPQLASTLQSSGGPACVLLLAVGTVHGGCAVLRCALQRLPCCIAIAARPARPATVPTHCCPAAAAMLTHPTRTAAASPCPAPPCPAAVSSMLELTVKTVPGDHTRPLQQDLSRLSPDLARVASQAASQGESLMGQLGSLAQQAGLPEQAASQLTGLAKLGMGMTSMFAQAVASSSAAEDIDALADEIGAFCGRAPGSGGGSKVPAALPARSSAAASGSSSSTGGAMSGSFDAGV